MHHGDALERRLRETAPDGIDAAYDAFGAGYIDLALRLGVATGRMVTITTLTPPRGPAS